MLSHLGEAWRTDAGGPTSCKADAPPPARRPGTFWHRAQCRTRQRPAASCRCCPGGRIDRPRSAYQLPWGGSGGSGCQCVGTRSEEHTSELQSLLRLSYAVFWLNKKKTKQTIRYNRQWIQVSTDYTSPETYELVKHKRSTQQLVTTSTHTYHLT